MLGKVYIPYKIIYIDKFYVQTYNQAFTFHFEKLGHQQNTRALIHLHCSNFFIHYNSNDDIRFTLLFS